MKYYLIAGEASGDLHGSNLMKALKQEDPNAQFRVWGGDLMRAEGAELVSHYRERAYMGFAEVISHLPRIMGFIKTCKADILQWKPDVIIFIDYPGFNMRIAEFARQQGFKTFYYISPQVWAWKENRVKKIKAFVDHLFVILPFEKDFFKKKWQYPVDFVGHPLLDAIKDFRKDESFLSRYHLQNKPLIALLPGSRKQEIAVMLGEQLKAAKHFPDHHFAVACAPSQPIHMYEEIAAAHNVPNLAFVRNETYQLLAHTEAALVTSGTATLETALFRVPEVVLYKGSKISYWIARRLVKHIKYISLVNLILDRELVKELIQDDMTSENIRKELEKILPNGEKRDFLLAGYAELAEKLGNAGASKKAAELMVGYLKRKQ